MKSMSPDELRKLALSTGAEAVIGGVPFNTSRTQVDAKPAPRHAPPIALVPPPAPPAQPILTRAEVDRLLAEQEARFHRQLTEMLGMLKATATNRAEGLVPEGFTPKYRSDGAIEFVGVQYRRLQ